MVAGLSEERALELTEALARRSLVQPETVGPEPRSRMLETVREFLAERLPARSGAAQIRRRHAGYYRTLADRAAVPLRHRGQNEWAGWLDAEAWNLGAAVGWYLAHDPVPLPGLSAPCCPCGRSTTTSLSMPTPGLSSSCRSQIPWTRWSEPSCCWPRW